MPIPFIREFEQKTINFYGNRICYMKGSKKMEERITNTVARYKALVKTMPHQIAFDSMNKVIKSIITQSYNEDERNEFFDDPFEDTTVGYKDFLLLQNNNNPFEINFGDNVSLYNMDNKYKHFGIISLKKYPSIGENRIIV